MNKKICITTLAFLCFLLISSILIFFFANKTSRYVLLFESLDSTDVFFEERYMPVQANKISVDLFVRELVLGPFADRLRPLFPIDTKVISCFLREKVLYVNLSEVAEMATGTASATKNAVDLLKRNVRLNFSNIHDIHCFINGKKVYEEEIDNVAFSN